MEANEYQIKAAETDNIPWEKEHGPDVPLLGAIGELGSVATVLKKWQRDEDYYDAFEEDLCEELGDILWYIFTLATRLRIDIDDWVVSTTNKDIFSLFYDLSNKVINLSQERNLIQQPTEKNSHIAAVIQSAIADINAIAVYFNYDISNVAENSIKKNRFYWHKDDGSPAKQYDQGFPVYEQLPRKFDIELIEIADGKSLILRMNGIIVGDRLTDNSFVNDGYRYHDIFHLANVATLGWSPVFRRMLRCKRKSVAKIDEVEDGARAAIVEEAVVNHIYDYARDHKFLEKASRVDRDLLKRIKNLVRGYEIDSCESWEWQDCILKSYDIFRQLLDDDCKGGIVSVDSDRRSIRFQPFN